jgi:nicotinate phosphoribosyltransferase
MEARGHRLRGIRIDSGDLAWLSCQARRMLDDAGLGYVEIVASNSLDEYTVASLKSQGACIDIWGIGTAMVTGGEQSALDGVYKMNAIQDRDGTWQTRMKISDQIAKATLPGIHQVRRFYDGDGVMIGDMIVDIDDDAYRNEAGAQFVMIDVADVTRSKRFAADTAFEDLLEPVMRVGKATDPLSATMDGNWTVAARSMAELASLGQARERLADDLSHLDDSHKRFLRPHVYPVGIEAALSDEQLALMQRLRDEGSDA